MNAKPSPDSIRRAEIRRRTAETEVRVGLVLEGDGRSKVDSGLPFLDHMLSAWARHARFDLQLSCRGDLEVDDHHSVEDVALVLGQALAEALGDKAGVQRFGSAHAPLDEALARAVVDLSGRPWAEINLGLERERLGTLACENLEHFFRSFASAAALTLHLDLLRGSNDHHRAEAAFKATAVALRAAVQHQAGGRIPSTKEVL